MGAARRGGGGGGGVWRSLISSPPPLSKQLINAVKIFALPRYQSSARRSGVVGARACTHAGARAYARAIHGHVILRNARWAQSGACNDRVRADHLVAVALFGNVLLKAPIAGTLS